MSSERKPVLTSFTDTALHSTIRTNYLNTHFPNAKASFAAYRSRPSHGGQGQVYADVLTIKHLEAICETLNIDLGYRLPVRIQHNAVFISVCFFDVLDWLDLAPQTIAKKRKLLSLIREAYRILSSRREAELLGLEDSDESLFQRLKIYCESTIDGHLLPSPSSAYCPPLTSFQYCAATESRSTLERLLRVLVGRQKSHNAQ